MRFDAKRLFRAGLFRIGLGLLAVGIAFLTIPAYAEYCEYQSGNKYACAGYEVVVSLLSLADTHNGSITALATVVIVYFTRVLAAVSRQQTKLAGTTLVLGQRARVSVDPAGIETNTFGDLIGQVVFVNNGHMPTSEFRWRIKILAFGGGNWVAETLTSADLEGDAVLPVGARWSMGSPACKPIPEMPTDYIYVYGRVEYTDGFDGKRHTNFCHRYTWARNVEFGINLPDGGHRVETKIDVGYARFHKNGNEAN